MAEMNAAQQAVQNEWRRVYRRIDDAENHMRRTRDELTTAVGVLAQLREQKTELENHAAAQGWELEPPDPVNTMSTVSGSMT